MQFISHGLNNVLEISVPLNNGKIAGIFKHAFVLGKQNVQL